MVADGDLPQRSSSPLKRRASSMEPEPGADAREDVDMISLPPEDAAESAASPQGASELPGETHTNGSSDLDKGTNGLPMINGHPPISEQIKTIQTLLRAFSEQQMQEGDIVYLVSRTWLEKALALGTATKQKAADQDQAELGPVDNADIIQAIVKDVNGDDAVRLVPGTGLDHFELFPKDAWDLLSTWYGVAEGQLPILRTAHNTAHDSTMPNIQVEFHPPVFTLHRLWSEVSPIPIEQSLKADNPPAPVVMCSTSHNLQSFLKRAKQRLDIPMERKVRVWSIPSKVPSGEPASSQAKASLLSTPPDSPKMGDGGARTNGAQDPWTGTLLAVDVFMKLEKNSGRDLLDFKDNTGNPNYNGHSTLAFYSLGMDQQLVLDESIDNTRHFVSTYNSKVASKDKGKQLPAKQHAVTSLASKASSIASGRSSPAPQGPMTRGRTKQKSGRTTGCVGLGNLGNTCYMNSALQCVRSVEELTKYFLVNEADNEINTDNPLGFSGHVAMAYSNLLHEIYRDPSPASVAPRHFKNVIGRYAPAFSGYGQQDSQEFLGFLLDGLQEDLSRIKKKPYIEKPDSTDEMINNPAAIREMADKVWDITKRRDDSVVADLFTGMYKSTLVCPVCEKISITFDPFTNLTLPLPIRSVWSSKMKYYPLNDTPVYIDCELDKASSMKSLKEFVAARVGTPVERLFAAEEYKEKFFKYYEDYSSVSEEIHSNDTPAIHELEAVPTNLSFKQPKKQHYRPLLDPADSDDVETPSWDTPAADRILVPVVHRLANQEPGFGGKRAQIRDLGSCVPPHFIVVSREEARSEDVIRRKVLEKIATFSSWAEFSAVEDSEAEVSTDADLVTAPASDADSAGDGKVVAKSVEGEEDMVDVAMKDVSGSAKPEPLKTFGTKRPKWTDSKEWLSPQLQNLFELSYFHETGCAIPTGWSSYSEDKEYPRLQTRAPAAPSDAQSPNSWSNSSENESDGEQLPESTVEAVTRMAEESDDEITPAVKDIAIRPISGRNGQKIAPVNRRGKMPRTYGRKNKRKAKQPHLSSPALEQQQQQVYDSFDLQAPSSADGGPLIRLGEGLVVDWNVQAWEMVFGKEDENDSRGAPLFAPSKLETLPDPALEEKRKARNTRRKNGLTLGECLDEFEKEEILSENDTWYCPRCKEHRRASKKFDLWRTPDILIVHLKRFSSSGWRRDKLDTKVDFPVEGLDLTKRVLDKASGKEEIFDLIAVDDHWGGLGGGHYTAFAKNFIDHKWYEYNDSSVSKVSDPERVVTQAAYLLFYRRRSTGPLGGPRFKAIVEKYEAGDDSSDEDEDMSDSGEGQRLGTGSSLRGSSSALTGAEATLRQGGRGLANGASTSTLAATVDQDCPPSYQQASAGFGDIGDEEPPVGTGILDFGQSSNLHKSIEEDEGIGGMADHHENSWPAQKWTFENLGGDETGSNEVQGNSSETANDADSMVIGHDGADRDAEMGFDGGDDDDLYGNTEVPEPAFGEEPPLLDPFNQANMDEIRDQVWKSHGVGPDQASEKAVDIHISEDDQKMV